MPHDIFISHSSIDDDIALDIYYKLTKEGFRCWIDDIQLQGGATSPDAIVNAIIESKAIVLIYTENINKSDIVLNEIAIAHNNKKTIISFKLENVDYRPGLQLYLATSQWIPVYKKSIINYLPKLIEDLKGSLVLFDSEPNDKTGIQITNFDNNEFIVTGRVYVRNKNIGVANTQVSIIEEETKKEAAKVLSDVNGVYQIELISNNKKLYQLHGISDVFGEGYSDSFFLNFGKAITKNIHLITDMRILGYRNPDGSNETKPAIQIKTNDDINLFSSRIEKYFKFYDFKEFYWQTCSNKEDRDILRYNILNIKSKDKFEIRHSKFASITIFKNYSPNEDDNDVLFDLKILSKNITKVIDDLSFQLDRKDESEFKDREATELFVEDLKNLCIVVIKNNLSNAQLFINRYRAEGKTEYRPRLLIVLNEYTINRFFEKG